MNNKLLEIYKKDLEEAQAVKTVITEYVSNMRNIYEARNIKENKRGSNFISKEVFKQIEWAKAQYKHPFVSNDTIVRLAPTLGTNNREFAQQSESLLNYFFTKKFDRYNFITDMLHVLLVEGTVIVRTGWDYKGKEIIEDVVVQQPIPLGALDPETKNTILAQGDPEHVIAGDNNILIHEQQVQVQKEIPITNKPTATLVKVDDIYLDPTATKQEELQYIIHRREVRLHELEEAGIYTNLEKVKKDLMNQSKDMYVEPYDQEQNPTLAFNLDDVDRKKIYMYEYWGYNKLEEDGEIQPIVCCWINDTIIRLEENPYPDKKIPYLITQCIKEPFSLWGKSLADMLQEHQRIKTGIMRGIFDDLAQSNNTQKGVQKGNLDPVNYRKFINGEPFEFNMSPNAFYQGTYNRIPSEVFKVLQDIDYDKQLLSGVIPMQGGQGAQAVYGSQASKSGAMTSLMLKELDMVNNIAENLIKPLLMKWLVYIYDLLDPEEISHITGMGYIEPDKHNIPNYADDFTIDISTQQTDEIKASELAFLMQTLGNSLPFEMTKLFMSEIAKLKKMPNLAQEIQQYQPQPDPVQQQLQQIELQKAQLELQLMQMQAQADTHLKEAKAKEAEAKATNVNTGTVKQKYGIDYQQKLKEMELKHQLELQKLQEQARLKQGEVLPNNNGISKPKQEPVSQLDIQNQTI